MGGAWEWPSKPGRGFSRLGGTSARRRGAFLWSAQLTLFGSENRALSSAVQSCRAVVVRLRAGGIIRTLCSDWRSSPASSSHLPA